MIRCLALLTAAALELAPVGRAAAAELTLQPGRPLDRDGIEQLVRQELCAAGECGEVAVQVVQPARPVANGATAPMHVVLADFRYDRRTGRFQGRLDAVLPTGETASIATYGQADELVTIAVPARGLARGETIGTDDVTVARVPAGSLAEDALRRPEDLVGRQAVRPLAAGRPARAAEVAAPWQVRRGDDTSMVFSRGALQILALATALDDGRAGDSIRVRNAASGEVRRATVVGERRVEVAGAVP